MKKSREMNPVAEWILSHKDKLYAITQKSWYYPCGCMLMIYIDDIPAIELHISDIFNTRMFVIEARYSYNYKLLGRVEVFPHENHICKNSYWDKSLETIYVTGNLISHSLQNYFNHYIKKNGEPASLEFRKKRCDVCSSTGDYVPISATHAFCKRCKSEIPICAIMNKPKYQA